MFLSSLSLAAVGPGGGAAGASGFTARDIHNKLVTTNGLTARGPLIITFWATWCMPCMMEMQALKKLCEKFKDNNLTVLAVSQDSPSEEAAVKQMVSIKKWPFVVVTDENKDIAAKYHVKAVPATFLIGSDNKIHACNRGYIAGDEKKLEEEIRKLVGTR